MAGKIDYHIHTWFSDGAASPEKIVRQAAEHGYKEIAITDHDGTDGIPEAAEAGKAEGICVIPGIELATETEEGYGLHILGYGIDIENAHLKEVLEDLRKKRQARNKKLLRLLSDMGYPLTDQELMLRPDQTFVGKPVIARAMVRKGYIKNMKEAFQKGKFLESPEARSIKKEKLKAGEAIALIEEAGGIAVLAHPVQIRELGDPETEAFYEKVDDLVKKLKEEGLKGLECFHSDHSQIQAQRFVKIAEKYNLAITRGSDFHGEDFS